MLKKTIAYTDFFGQERTDDFYFNLTEAEVVELNVRDDLETIKNTRDPNQLMDAFKRFIRLSYGIRLQTGDFIKEERSYLIFISGNAYSKLFMELIQDAGYAAQFVNAVLPDMSSGVKPGQPQDHLPKQTAAPTPTVVAQPTQREFAATELPSQPAPTPEPIQTSTPPVIIPEQYQAPIPPHPTYQEFQDRVQGQPPQQ